LQESDARQPDGAVRDHAYATYVEQKGWVNPFEYDAEEAETCRAEIGTDRLDGAALLEIGFGNGGLLAWARDHGAIAVGCEINPACIAQARSAGIELVDADLAKASAAHPGRFDFIVAFDVFEHLSLGQIMETLKACSVMLKPGGRLILRFPNAQSPFGLVPQHGDVTHVTPLSAAKIVQILPGTGLTLVRSKPAHRVLGPSVARQLVRRVRYAIQTVIDALIAFIYPNPERVSMAPVVVAILERQPDR
jgi:2-polyprenyl-3-methyl-5-hydroxy-6-metoxy-1,4-benzoquinol methylase